MLELKAAQFLTKVAQNASMAIYLKINVFQNSPKSQQAFWLLL